MVIKFLIKISIPFLKLIGKVKLPFTSKNKIFKHYYDIERSLKPMDIILTKSSGHMSNLVNFGKVKHAILYIGNSNGIPSIIEATGEGVIKRSLIECLSDKDLLIIVRPNIFGNGNIEDGIFFANTQVGKPYDYEFNISSNKGLENLYCSELCYYAIKEINPNAPIELRDRFGVKSIVPMDLLNLTKSGKFEKIIDIS